MEMNDREKRRWRLCLGFLAIALAGSLWAALGASGCGSCEAARDFVGGKALAAIGVAYYAILLAAALLAGPCLFVFAGIQIAAGVHGALLAVLFQTGNLCLPCIATGVAAVAALGLSIALEPASAYRASLLMPGAAFALQSWILLSGGLAAASGARDRAREAVRSELASPPEPAGKARLVAYVRPDCGYCQELETNVLPAIEQEFQGRLAVERRSAENFPGMPTPTLILSGAEGRRMFPGLPPVEDLRRALREVLGERDGNQTLLSQPR